MKNAQSRKKPATIALREATLLLLGACLVTTGSWLLRDDRLPLRTDPAFYELELAAPLVSFPVARKHYDTGDYLFIDTRSDAAERPSIPGSFIIRNTTFSEDLAEAADFISPSDPMILFGSGNLQPVSDVAGLFMERGYRNLLIFAGGMESWSASGGPVSGGKDGDE